MNESKVPQEEVTLVSSISDLIVGIATGVSPIGPTVSLVQFFSNRKEQRIRKVFSAFMSANSNVDELKTFITKCDEDQNFNEQLSERLLDLLGELDEEKKGLIVGNLFAAFRTGKLQREEFLHLSDIVHKSFLPYLDQLAKNKYGNFEVTEYLKSIGLVVSILETKEDRHHSILDDKTRMVEYFTKSARQMRKFGYPNATEHHPLFDNPNKADFYTGK